MCLKQFARGQKPLYFVLRLYSRRAINIIVISPSIASIARKIYQDFGMPFAKKYKPINMCTTSNTQITNAKVNGIDNNAALVFFFMIDLQSLQSCRHGCEQLVFSFCLHRYSQSEL